MLKSRHSYKISTFDLIRYSTALLEYGHESFETFKKLPEADKMAWLSASIDVVLPKVKLCEEPRPTMLMIQRMKRGLSLRDLVLQLRSHVIPASLSAEEYRVIEANGPEHLDIKRVLALESYFQMRWEELRSRPHVKQLPSLWG